MYQVDFWLCFAVIDFGEDGTRRSVETDVRQITERTTVYANRLRFRSEHRAKTLPFAPRNRNLCGPKLAVSRV